MPAKLVWTAAQDNQIRRLCIEGASWNAIATILGVTRWTVIERGHRIGALRPPREAVAARDDPARDPLPAGHPRSWGAITAGTVLADVPYARPAARR